MRTVSLALIWLVVSCATDPVESSISNNGKIKTISRFSRDSVTATFYYSEHTGLIDSISLSNSPIPVLLFENSPSVLLISGSLFGDYEVFHENNKITGILKPGTDHDEDYYNSNFYYDESGNLDSIRFHYKLILDIPFSVPGTFHKTSFFNFSFNGNYESSLCTSDNNGSKYVDTILFEYNELDFEEYIPGQLPIIGNYSQAAPSFLANLLLTDLSNPYFLATLYGLEGFNDNRNLISRADTLDYQYFYYSDGLLEMMTVKNILAGPDEELAFHFSFY